MDSSYLSQPNIHAFIRAAMAEDIGAGDHSSLGAISERATKHAHLLIKDEGIVAGLELSEQILRYADSALEVEMCKKDGEHVCFGEEAFRVWGDAKSILSVERLILNCMQRMSAIATNTHRLCSLIKEYPAKVLDTRKTTPLFRLPEKWAVRIGGGTNHRFGLYDMIMLKDNHIDFAGGVANALTRTLAYMETHALGLDIVVEVRNLNELDEVLQIGQVRRVLLDNMPPQEMRKAVQMSKGQLETEASGGISEKTIVEIADTGVDYISVGALTHSYHSMDMSLKAR